MNILKCFNKKGVIMKKKKIVYIVILILFIILVGIAIFNNVEIKDNQENNIVLEYTPEEEISDKQNRNTIVTLYFVNNKTGEMVPEARSLDAKELLEDPYKKVINFLIEGSEDESLENTIPEGTILNNVSLKGEEIIVDFNETFINDDDVKSEIFVNRVYSVVDTLLEFKDISSVKILINGEEVDGLKESFVKREN